MDAALAPVAAQLGVDVAALAAVVDVECAGSGLGADGRPVIRLEVHRFWTLVNAVNHGALAQVDARFRVIPHHDPKTMKVQPWLGHQWLDSKGVWHDLHTGQKLEWEAYMCAESIDVRCAINATSWGMGQLIGDISHPAWLTVGYADPFAFRDAQYKHENQVADLGKYIVANPKLIQALKTLDWYTFARIYNGSGKPLDYSIKLAAAYAKHKSAP